MADLTGRQFGRYYTVERLGGDRIGDLFSAYDPTPNREQHVALRVIRRKVARRMGFRKFFDQEMRQSARLFDTALIRVVDFGLQEDQNLYYVAMELLNGVALSELLRYLRTHNVVLHVPDAIHLVRQISEAIEFVRINRCIPRSLSSTSIMIVPDEGREYTGGYQAVLTDPGLLRFLDTDLESDLRTEVYEMGRLLYQLILGEPVAAPIVPPRVLFPELPAQVERVIFTALASIDKDRHDTYDHTGLMAAALANTVAWTYRSDAAPTHKRVISLDDWLIAKVESQELSQPPGTDRPQTAALAGAEEPSEPLEVKLGLGPNDKLSVAPGATAKVELSVTNTSREIVHSRIFVDGVADNWWTASPQEFRIGEQGSDTSTRTSELAFHPEAGPQSTAGDRRLRIRLADTRNGGQTRGQMPATLTVATVRNCRVDAKPQVVKAGEPVKITIANQGNVTENISFSWWDKENALDFEVEGNAVSQLTAIVEAGGRETIEFRARPKRLHWFGKDREYTYEIDAKNRTNKVQIGGEQKQKEYKIQSRRLIPVWLVVVGVLTFVALLLSLVYWLRPQIVNATSCEAQIVQGAFPGTDSESRVGVCWESTKFVGKFMIEPGNLIVAKGDKKKIFNATEPVTQTVELVASNPLSFLPFHEYREALPLTVITPTATPMPLPPVPGISSFCIVATGAQIQQACAPGSYLSYVRGAVENLELTWATENLNGHQLVLSPMAAAISGLEGAMTIPAPIRSLTYTLSIVGADLPTDTLAVTTVLSIPVIVNTVACRVDVPQLYLRESPGQDFVTLATLPGGTPIILLSAPLDFQQNDDPYRWVRAVVADTNEQGWLAFDQDPNQPNDDWIICGQKDPLAGTSFSIGGANINQTDNNALNNGTDSGTPTLTNSDSPGTNDADGMEALPDLNQLPKTLPTFGPTVTHTPTPTPTPTETPAPTATPQPTKDLLFIFTHIEPDSIQEGECVTVEWNIVGVKEVHFDFGRGVFEPIYDNRQQLMELCEGKNKDFGGENNDEILFRWKIILDDGMERIRAEKLQVEITSQP